MGADFDRNLAYLYGLQGHGIKPGLSLTIALLGALGDPHQAFRVVHVGGTNGKGSTAAMVASVLAAQGYRVGLYTSPHLVDFTERIRINGAPISPERVGELTEAIRHAAGTRLMEPPTFFEATTALAFLHFAEQGVQYAVVEVGMGGRFDATNVLTPLVSVITTIGLDHQEYLGDTPEAIAREKAGIVKRGVPVVTGRLGAGPLRVIRAAASDRLAPCLSLGEDFDILGETPQRFAYRGVWRAYDGLSCPLAGRHQLDNAACALAALELADERGATVGEGAIRDGIRTVRWPGRLELAGRKPDLLLDGAHNPQAAEALAAYLTALRGRGGLAGRGRLILVIGMMRDKDHRGVLARLTAVPGVAQVIVTRAAHPRAAAPEDLARKGADLGVPVQVCPSVGEAFARARALAGPDDTILITGSLLVVGEAKAILDETTVSALRG
jgi:dihydrofolate synthase/folylpolyglutamate synthase